MFAIVADEVLYLKADDDNRNGFIERHLEPFYYEKQGRQQMISYYQAPEEVFEDAGEMCAWAQQAYEAALRAEMKKRKKVRTRNPK